MPRFLGLDWYAIAASRKEIPITEGIFTDLVFHQVNIKLEKTDDQSQDIKTFINSNVIPFNLSSQIIPPPIPPRKTAIPRFPQSQVAAFQPQFAQTQVTQGQVALTRFPQRFMGVSQFPSFEAGTSQVPQTHFAQPKVPYQAPTPVSHLHIAGPQFPTSHFAVSQVQKPQFAAPQVTLHQVPATRTPVHQVVPSQIVPQQEDPFGNVSFKDAQLKCKLFEHIPRICGPNLKFSKSTSDLNEVKSVENVNTILVIPKSEPNFEFNNFEYQKNNEVWTNKVDQKPNIQFNYSHQNKDIKPNFHTFASPKQDIKPKVESQYFKTVENPKPLSYFNKQKNSDKTSRQELFQRKKVSSTKSFKFKKNSSNSKEIQKAAKNANKNLYVETPKSFSDPGFDFNKFRVQRMNEVWTKKLDAEE